MRVRKGNKTYIKRELKGGNVFTLSGRMTIKSAAQFALKISRKKYNDTIVYT